MNSPKLDFEWTPFNGCFCHECYESKGEFIVLSFYYSEITTKEQIEIIRIILKNLNKKTLKIELVSEVAKKYIDYLLSFRLEIKQIQGEIRADGEFKNILNFAFIENIENNDETYIVKVNKGFYQAMNRYYKI